MPTVKQAVLDVLQRLPDDCTWEDIRYHLYVAKSVMAGLEDMEAGRVITHDEMKQSVSQWQPSSGQNVPLGS